MLLPALAIAPAIAIIMYILAKDKYNREPFKNLLVSFPSGCLHMIPAIFTMSSNTPGESDLFTNELQIRGATIDDIPVIRALAYKIWLVTYSPILSEEQINYMLKLFYSEDALARQMQSHQFFLGFHWGNPVAFASVGSTEEQHVFKLHKIYLLTSLQGKGMGRFLIDYIIGVIKSKGATDLELNVNRHNTALGFYQKLGFGIIKTEDIDIGEGYWMNDYVLRKLL